MIKIVSNIMRKIWLPLLAATVLLIVFIAVLQKGIFIESLSVSNVEISKLYIKLDKKLFVEINKIKIIDDVSKSNTFSVIEINDVLDLMPKIHNLFETILIDKIEYGNESAKLTYKDNDFYFDSPRLKVKTKMEIIERGFLRLDVEQIFVPNFDIDLSGALTADIEHDKYDFDGRFRLFDINGNAKLGIENEILRYQISSDEFVSPKRLVDYLKAHVKELPKEAANWIYGYTKAASYQLLSLNGIADLEKMDFYPDSIKASVIARDVNVTFCETTPSANVKNVRLDFADGNITFLIRGATYEGKKVGANVTIYNLIDGVAGVNVDLKSNAYYDESINKILKCFIDVELPIEQTAGISDAHVNIDVKVAAVDVNVVGRFELENATIAFADTPIKTPYSLIELNNSIVTFADTRLKMDDMFDISAVGVLNATEGHMDANSTIHFLKISAQNKNIVTLSNTFEPFSLDINDSGVHIGFEKFDTNITFFNKSGVVLGSLEKLYPYSQLLQEYDIKNGSVSLEITNMSHINGAARLEGLKLPLLSRGKAVDSFNGRFFIRGDEIYARSNGRDINVHLGKSIDVKLNNLDISLDLNSSATSLENITTPLTLKSSNGNIIIADKNITVLSQNLSAQLSKNGSLNANITYQNGDIEVRKDVGNFSIYAAEVKSEFINRLVNKDFFKDGIFSATVSGESQNEFSGIATIRDTKMKDFILLNNFIAFLNTIPALATLSDPKYSSSGFPVKSGVIEFSRMSDLIYIPNLFLEGYSSDIMGYGYVALDTNEIYLDLTVSTVKALSSLIDLIPIVNYIVLGEDGRIEISVAVRGTLDNPKVETNVIGDTLMTPFNIIKRVFQLPFHLFN